MIDGIRPPQTPRAPQDPANNAYSPGNFVLPQQAAAQDEQQLPKPDDSASVVLPPPGKRSFKQWLRMRTKKQWIIFVVVLLAIVGGGGVGAYLALAKDEPAAKTVVKARTPPPPPPPTTEASRLTGVQVGFDINKRPVIAIMVENSEDARPQSGIDQAGIVFEAVAEGGITRFLTLYQDSAPDYIGPVRSVRPYYLEWLYGFDAAVAHVGGSAQALANIKQWGVKDLDQGANGAYFRRISSRYAPHNVYTSMAQMHELAAKKSFGTSNYTGFVRKAKEEPSKVPNAKSIDFNISGPVFNPHFDYDPATNSYARSQAGAPHLIVDGAGVQVQIKPKVVIALTMAQGKNGIYTTYGTIGSGHAYIFQDGTVTEATWQKNDKAENFKFTDAAGNSVKLTPGQTWISVVGSNDRVTYKP